MAGGFSADLLLAHSWKPSSSENQYDQQGEKKTPPPLRFFCDKALPHQHAEAAQATTMVKQAADMEGCSTEPFRENMRMRAGSIQNANNPSSGRKQAHGRQSNRVFGHQVSPNTLNTNNDTQGADHQLGLETKSTPMENTSADFVVVEEHGVVCGDVMGEVTTETSVGGTGDRCALDQNEELPHKQKNVLTCQPGALETEITTASASTLNGFGESEQARGRMIEKASFRESDSCCPLWGSEPATVGSIPDGVVVAPDRRPTESRRASVLVLQQQHGGDSMYEHQHVQPRSSRCSSMSAAATARVSSISSPLRSCAPAVLPIFGDVNAATAVTKSEKEAVSGCSSKTSSPAAIVSGQGRAQDMSPTQNSLFGAYASTHSWATAKAKAATIRRASIPCRRSEKHPALLRRRLLSDGSSGLGLVDRTCFPLDPPPAIRLVSEMLPKSDSAWPSEFSGYPSDVQDDLRPGREEQDAPATRSWTRNTEFPADFEESAEPSTSRRRQYVPSTEGSSTPTSAVFDGGCVRSPLAFGDQNVTSSVRDTCWVSGRRSGAKDRCVLPASQEETITPLLNTREVVSVAACYQSPSTVGSPPATPVIEDAGLSPDHVCCVGVDTPATSTCALAEESITLHSTTDTLFRLVDYDSSPSPAECPVSTSDFVDPDANLSNDRCVEACTPTVKMTSALRALADYGVTPSAARSPEQQSYQELSPMVLVGESTFNMGLDESTRIGTRGGDERVGNEEPVTTDPAESRGESVEYGKEEKEEMTDAPCSYYATSHERLVVRKEKPIVTKEIQAGVTFAARGHAVEDVGEEPSTTLSAESQNTLRTTDKDYDLTEAAEGQGVPDVVEGAVAKATGAAQDREPFEFEGTNSVEMLCAKEPVPKPASAEASYGLVEEGYVEIAVQREDTKVIPDPSGSGATPDVGVMPQRCESVPVGENPELRDPVQVLKENVRPLRRSTRRRSIAPLTAPSFGAIFEREASIGTVGVCGGNDNAALPQEANPRRRTGRRRSIASVTPSSTTAPTRVTDISVAVTAVDATSAEPSLPFVGPGVSDDQNPSAFQEGSLRRPRRRRCMMHEKAPSALLPPPTQAAISSPAETESSALPPAGTGFCGHQELVTLPERRPPRRSGRRRSIMPKRIPPTPSPPSTPATSKSAVETESTLLPSIGTGSGSDQDFLLLPEGRPPRRSERLRSIAPKSIPQDFSTPPQTPPTSPTSTAKPGVESAVENLPSAAEASGGEQDYLALPGGPLPRRSGRLRSVGVISKHEHPSLSSPNQSPKESVVEDGIPEESTLTVCASSSVKDEGPAPMAGGFRAVVPQGDVHMEGKEGPTKRRSARRKSLRGLRSAGLLSERTTQTVVQPASEIVAPSRGSGDCGVCERDSIPLEEGDETKAADGVASVQEGGEHIATMAGLLNKCMRTVREEALPDDALVPLLESLSAAVVDAEAYVLEKDEMRAVVGADNEEINGERRRTVRMCAFDFSTVGMPVDSGVGSEVPAREVARRLERVIGAQHDLREGLKVGSDGDGEGVESSRALKTFVRELRAAAAAAAGGGASGMTAEVDANPTIDAESNARPAPATEPVTPEAPQGDLTFARKEKEMSRAALVLLGQLESLEKPEGPVESPLSDRLAGILASLIRFTLRIRLDAPPEKLTRAPTVLPSYPEASYREEKRRAEIPPPSHFSKVHKVVEVSQGDATFSAAFSKALVRLDGFSCEVATAIFAAVEAFEDCNDQKRLVARDGCPLRVESALQLLSATADVVDAIRARRFVLSLLEFDGVQDAIVQAGGWGDVETWASALKRLEGSANIDTPLTLLVDVGALQDWLRSEPTWRDAEERAEEVLQRLLDLPPLKEVVQRVKQRWMCPDAYQLLRQEILEVQERFQFPEVNRASTSLEVETAVEPIAVEVVTKAAKSKQAGRRASAAAAAASSKKLKKKKGDERNKKPSAGGRKKQRAP